MAAPQTFDLARTTFDSWPWMFGKQWETIMEQSRTNGIESAGPQIHMLVCWCAALEDEETVQRKLIEIDSLKISKGTSLVDAPAWMKLQRLLLFCVKVAKESRAWDYKKQEEKRHNQTKEALSTNGRAVP